MHIGGDWFWLHLKETVAKKSPNIAHRSCAVCVITKSEEADSILSQPLLV